MKRAPRTSPPPAAPLLTLQEVAAQLTISLRTVQVMRAAGRLRVLVLGTRCVRVERGEIERVLRDARREQA